MSGEERQNQNERDSQLSAMFDGELAAAECELLARRLTRDEALRGQWSRYALIGAALRAERGVKLHDRVALRVQSALSQEPAYGDSTSPDAGAANVAPAGVAQSATASSSSERWMRLVRPVAGAGIAAGVAAVSIMWMRTQEPDNTLLASAPADVSIVLEPEPQNASLALNTALAEPEPVSNGEPERYSTPAPNSQPGIAPPARFANYVVAHSEYSGPLTRRMALLGIVGAEGQVEVAEPADITGTGAPDAP